MFWLQLVGSIILVLFLLYILGYICIKPFFKQIPDSLFVLFGFVIYQALFWIGAIFGVYQHWSWQKISTIVSLFFLIFIVGMILLGLRKSKKEQTKYIALPTECHLDKWLILVVLLGVIHATIQIGFWNTDHALSDNSFYAALTSVAKNNPAVLAINPADGMTESNLWVNYFISTYELSVTYLSAVTAFKPAACMMLIMPYIGSIGSALIFYELAKKFIQRSDFSFLVLAMFYVAIYFSMNYRGSINDYHLEEWFTFYYYTGKVFLRYLALPILIYLLMDIYELPALQKGEKLKQSLPYILLTSIVTISFYALSPVGSLYALSLLFIFYLLLLVTKRQTIGNIILLASGSLMGFVGLVLSYITQTASDDGGELGSVVQSAWFNLLGIQSEHVSMESYKSFFMYENTDIDYIYYRWPHIVIVVVIICAVILMLYGYIHRKNKRGQKWRAKLNELKQTYPLLLPFGLYFPLFYLLFTLSPPVMHLVSAKLFTFTYTRLVGSYIYEIIAIVWILVVTQYAIDALVQAKKENKKSWHRSRMNSFVIIASMCIYVMLFILYPQRPSVYQQAMDQQRVSRLRYKDDYYNGTFNYKRLATNPTKMDEQAEQIISALQDIPGDKVVMGTINQFFGLSHVRIDDPSIKVVKTRFTTYSAPPLSDASYLLRYYFSPWDTKFDEYHEEYTIEEANAALELFGVEYLVVIKSYGTHETFGEDIGNQLSWRIEEIQETEDFFIYKLTQ